MPGKSYNEKIGKLLGIPKGKLSIPQGIPEVNQEVNLITKEEHENDLNRLKREVLTLFETKMDAVTADFDKLVKRINA